MKTEIKLVTPMGLVKYAETEQSMLDAYNNGCGRLHEFRDGPQGRELWHKGHGRMVGVATEIPARSAQ